MDDLWHIIIYFFIYAFFGWAWETIYVGFRERKLVYRGFLLGPYCPIYGFGVLLLLEVLSPLKGNIPLLFVVSLVVMTLLEYATSFVLEKLFHQRWWDYSSEFLNVRGRVALKSSLFWGGMSVLIIYAIQPRVELFADWAIGFGVWIPVAIVAVMSLDASHTIVRVAGLSKLLHQLPQFIDERADEFNTQIAKRVAELRRSGRLRFTERRLLRAFPNAEDVRLHSYSDIRLILLALQRKPKRVATKKSV